MFPEPRKLKWCLGAECYGNFVIKLGITKKHAYKSGSMAPIHSKLGTWRRFVVTTKLRPFYTQERTFTYCTGGWVDLVDGLEDKKYLATREL